MKCAYPTTAMRYSEPDLDLGRQSVPISKHVSGAGMQRLWPAARLPLPDCVMHSAPSAVCTFIAQSELVHRRLSFLTARSAHRAFPVPARRRIHHGN
jgi:hypothetical protein